MTFFLLLLNLCSEKVFSLPSCHLAVILGGHGLYNMCGIQLSRRQGVRSVVPVKALRQRWKKDVMVLR